MGKKVWGCLDGRGREIKNIFFEQLIRIKRPGAGRNPVQGVQDPGGGDVVHAGGGAGVFESAVQGAGPAGQF